MGNVPDQIASATRAELAGVRGRSVGDHAERFVRADRAASLCSPLTRGPLSAYHHAFRHSTSKARCRAEQQKNCIGDLFPMPPFLNLPTLAIVFVSLLVGITMQRVISG